MISHTQNSMHTYVQYANTPIRTYCFLKYVLYMITILILYGFNATNQIRINNLQTGARRKRLGPYIHNVAYNLVQLGLNKQKEAEGSRRSSTSILF